MKRWSVIKMLFPWFMLLAVTSCGTTTDYAGGGIGGTGISVGKITASGTGTVDVNGIVFDTSNASVMMDGKGGSKNDLKPGMVVKIRGEFNQDGKTGLANSIDFRDNLEGPVVLVDPLGTGDAIVVLGQTVVVDSTTYFDDFPDPDGSGTVEVTEFMNKITQGNVVEVSGLVDTDGVIHASYISLKAETIGSDGHEIEVKGTITNINPVDMRFTIGSLTIEYNNSTQFEHMSITDLSEGIYVEVKSTSPPDNNNVLIASSIEIEGEDHDADEGERIEVEGFVSDVTGVVPDISFVVKGHNVQTNADTVVEKGNLTDIKPNTKVEVKGTVDAYGVLVADNIEIKSADDGSNEDSGSNDSGD